MKSESRFLPNLFKKNSLKKKQKVKNQSNEKTFFFAYVEIYY